MKCTYCFNIKEFNFKELPLLFNIVNISSSDIFVWCPLADTDLILEFMWILGYYWMHLLVDIEGIVFFLYRKPVFVFTVPLVLLGLLTGAVKIAWSPVTRKNINYLKLKPE